MFEGLVPSSRRRGSVGRRPGSIWDMRDMFEEFFGESFLPAFFTGDAGMKADIRETDKEYIVEVEVPGVRKEDVKVDYSDGRLTVAVETNEIINEEGKNYIRKERRYGSRARSFLFDDVKEDAIKAKFENGVLVLTLPKMEGTRVNSRKIEIE